MNPNCNESEQTESARADSVQRLVTRRRELKDSIAKLQQDLRFTERELTRQRRNGKTWPKIGQRIRFSRICRNERVWFEGVFKLEGTAIIVQDDGKKYRFINRGWQPCNAPHEPRGANNQQP